MPPREAYFQDPHTSIPLARHWGQMEASGYQPSRYQPSGSQSSTMGDSEENNKLPSESVEDGINVLRFSVYIVLWSLTAGIGSATFLLIRSAEYINLNNQYSSGCTLIQNRVNQDITKKMYAAELVHKIYSSASYGAYGGMFPNMTLPGFQSSMEGILQLAQLRFIAVSPLITTDTRYSWEAYATANAGLLDNSSFPTNSSTTDNDYLIAYGIANRTEGGERKRAGNYISGSPYPTTFFPTWQTTRSESSYVTIMVDPHSRLGTRSTSIDQVISTKKAVFTDIVRLSRDGSTARYSTLIYGPIFSLETGNTMVGLFQGGFTWDEIFSNVTFESIVIVLQTDTEVLSYTVGTDGLQSLGSGT